jgi:hypothetical protein
MSIEWEAGASLFPPVLWVDAIKRGVAIDLIFGTRIEGARIALRCKDDAHTYRAGRGPKP